MQSKADRKRRGTLVDYNILVTAQSASPHTPIDHSGVLPTPFFFFFYKHPFFLEHSTWGLTHSISQSEATVMFREDIRSQNKPRTKATARNLRYTLEASKFETRRGVWQQLSHVYLQTFNATGQPLPPPSLPQLLQCPLKTLIQTGPLGHTGCIFTHTHTVPRDTLQHLLLRTYRDRGATWSRTRLEKNRTFSRFPCRKT